MTINLRHPFVSAKADGTDASKIQPSNWNALHQLTAAAKRLLGRAAATDGDVQEISIGSGLDLSDAGVLSASNPATLSQSNLTTVLMGDSITANSGTMPTLDCRGWFPWANALAGAPFEILANLGVAGQKSDYVLNTELPLAIALNPTHCEVMVGANDIGVYTASATIANLTDIYSQLFENGIYVRAYTVLPCGAANTNALRGQLLYVNEFIKNYWKNSKGGECIDTFSAMVDPTSTSMANISGVTSDGTHPSGYGAFLMGVLIAPSLSRWTVQDILPSSAADDYSICPAGANVLENPMFLGSAGTSTFGGTIASKYIVNGSSISACTNTVVASPSGFGNVQKCEITASAVGAGLNIINGVSIESKLETNTNYFAVCEFYIDANPVNLAGISFSINNGEVNTPAALMASVNTYPITMTSAQKLTLRAPLWNTGAVLPGYCAVQAAVLFSGAGSATVSIGRMAVYKAP